MSAKFLYCVLPEAVDGIVGQGIKGEDVFTVTGGDFSVVCHECGAVPYSSTDEEEAQGYVLDYLSIVDDMMERFGIVLPFRFNTIFEDEGPSLQGWIERNSGSFEREFERLDGKAEYTLKVEVEKGSIQLDSGGSGGKQYLERQKEMYDRKKELSGRFERYLDNLDTGLKGSGVDFETEGEGRRAILLEKGETSALEGMVDEAPEGIDVELKGPWPPFSFTELEL